MLSIERAAHLIQHRDRQRFRAEPARNHAICEVVYE
jgi:hypothetical protein